VRRGAAQLGVDVVVADQRGYASVEAEAAQAHVDGRAQLVQAYLGHAATVPGAYAERRAAGTIPARGAHLAGDVPHRR
jgi:alpha-beta hydrolase superfamily lysophospholipase